MVYSTCTYGMPCRPRRVYISSNAQREEALCIFYVFIRDFGLSDPGYTYSNVSYGEKCSNEKVLKVLTDQKPRASKHKREAKGMAKGNSAPRPRPRRWAHSRGYLGAIARHRIHVWLLATYRTVYGFTSR